MPLKCGTSAKVAAVILRMSEREIRAGIGGGSSDYRITGARFDGCDVLEVDVEGLEIKGGRATLAMPARKFGIGHPLKFVFELF